MNEEQARRRRWWTLVVLCLSLVVTAIGNTSMNLAIPRIVAELGATGSQLQWLIDGYIIVFASLLLVMGSLGDRFGRKKFLHVGIALFGAFSGFAALQSSPVGLIAARALMGVGAAMIFPTTLSILTNVFSDPKERATAIGIWSGFAGVGIAVGPLGAGLLLDHFYWGSVFLINVPLCAIALIAGFVLIPDSRDPDVRPLDPIGSGLSVVALVALLFGIIEGPDLGWTSTPVLAGLAAAALLFALFIWWELRVEHPVLDLRFFADPRFTAASVTITLTFFALVGSTFLLTQYFQFVLGYTPLQTGFLTAPVAVGMMIGGPMAPRLVERLGTKAVVAGGLTLVGLSLLAYSSDLLMSSWLWGGIVRLAFGLGLGSTTAPATESIMGSLPPARAGVGSAVNDTTRQAGGALGVAVLGSLFAASYRSSITSRLDGLPAEVLETARDSIGKALSWADAAPGAAADRVANEATAAYIDSMHIVYPVAAAVILVAIVITIRYLPATAPAPRAVTHQTDAVVEIEVGARSGEPARADVIDEPHGLDESDGAPGAVPADRSGDTRGNGTGSPVKDPSPTAGPLT